jgi:hypothetical protein
MQKKTLLLATFVSPDYLDKFLFRIYKKFNVNKKNVFVFETETGELLLTYKLILDFDQKINIKEELHKTIQVHKKGTTFFTINAMNRLIERDYELVGGNVNHSEYNLDWVRYQNSIILLKNNELDILSLNRKIIE